MFTVCIVDVHLMRIKLLKRGWRNLGGNVFAAFCTSARSSKKRKEIKFLSLCVFTILFLFLIAVSLFNLWNRFPCRKPMNRHVSGFPGLIYSGKTPHVFSFMRILRLFVLSSLPLCKEFAENFEIDPLFYQLYPKASTSSSPKTLYPAPPLAKTTVFSRRTKIWNPSSPFPSHLL